MKKRILSFLLAAAMTAACLPLGAFAAEGTDSAAEDPAPTGIIGSADGPTQILVSDGTALPADSTDSAGATDVPVLVPETDAEDAAEGPQDPHSFTYVAFGDSIAAGVGLTNFVYNDADVFYDISPNFKGYSDECYVAYVADALGLDRDHAINLGLPALMTKDLLEMVRDGKMSQFNQPPAPITATLSSRTTSGRPTSSASRSA